MFKWGVVGWRVCFVRMQKDTCMSYKTLSDTADATKLASTTDAKENHVAWVCDEHERIVIR